MRDRLIIPIKPQPQEGLSRRMLFAQAAGALAGQAAAPVVNGRPLNTVEMLRLAVYARVHGFLPPL